MQLTPTSKREPIAIIGMGCRFPGHASNPQDFWRLLCEGFDAISELPADRWDPRRFYHPLPHSAGKMYVNKGGFLREKWEEFDAEFFHISPREAVFLDPQQRLLLELVWEALEDGGIIPSTIRGTNTGVYIGAFTTDWQSLHNNPTNVRHCSMYSGMNGSMTILSARLSHFFDWKGPCLTVDTACSSSLVAVHLACQNLWQDSCSLALAGGVNAILIPQTTIALSKGRFLNPEGYCRPFDAQAKGYVRGEGGGVVILKRLSDALRDGDDIYALIRGTGVNHDGNTPGIAHPDAGSQQSLISTVLAESHVEPHQIGYVEAHGTGTSVGDPIEAQALNHVFNTPSRTFPCFVGAVKSNMGHLEAAAGIAGLIKTALTLKHGRIPPNLHFNTRNPAIPLEQYCLKIPAKLESIPSAHSYFAGVNAFGYGGTNAHAILESVSDKEYLPAVEAGSYLLPYSAKTAEGLQHTAGQHARYLEKNPQTSLQDIAFTLSRKRTAFDHRLGVYAHSREDLLAKLQAIAHGTLPEECVKGKVLSQNPPLCFVYTGMGPQSWGMGKQLSECYPRFLQTLQACDEHLQTLAGWSLLAKLFKDTSLKPIEDPVMAQLSNFAIQAALTDLLKSLGISPNAVVGHSIGEVSAAYASGALTLHEGLTVAYHRSRLQALKKNQGTMLAAGLTCAEAEAYTIDLQKQFSIAAINGPQSLTLAGTHEDLEALAAVLEQKNIFHRFLKVNIAYHSYQMDDLENEVLKSLESLRPQKPSLPLISTVYGEEIGDQLLDAGYWWENIRQPVDFQRACKTLIQQGCRLFMELGPQPVLSASIKENLSAHAAEGVSIAALNRKKKEDIAFHESLGALFVHGYPLDWELIHPEKGHFVRLPTYAWQKKPYWIESEESRQYRLSAALHPMLSRRAKVPELAWQVEVNEQFFPWLKDHKVGGSVVFPAAGFVEAGLAIWGEFPCTLENVEFRQILSIDNESDPLLQITLDKKNNTFAVHSLSGTEEWEWVCHASGKFCTHTGIPSSALFNKNHLTDMPYISAERLYSRFSLQELDYGPAFRGIKKLWKGEKEAYAEIACPFNENNYHCHPALLDSVLQTLIGTLDAGTHSEELILPSRIERLILHAAPKQRVFCHAQCTKQTKEHIIGLIRVYDDNNMLCLEIIGLECRILKPPSQPIEDFLYAPAWEERPLKNCSLPQPTDEEWLVVSPSLLGEPAIMTALQHQKILAQSRSFQDFASPEKAEKTLEIFKNTRNMTIVLACIPESSIEDAAAGMHLMQALEKMHPGRPAKLIVLTRGMRAVHETNKIVNPYGSILYGIFRVSMHEYPALDCRFVDLDPDDVLAISPLLEEAVQTVGREESAWRQGRRYVSKLKKQHAFGDASNSASLHSPEKAFALHLPAPGRIENLAFKEIVRAAPRKDEVEIEVHSTSLNFKDLLKVLGLLDKKAFENTYFGEHFGMECAGTVVAVGPKVKKFAVGDTVCAFAPETFQSHVTLAEQYVCPIPPGTALENAAIYVPFITVLRALKELAQLKKNETILIHSAAGAVGLAAIQYAKYKGAKIIATASQEEKHAFLRNLGVDFCTSSRSLTFVEDVLKETKGRGVDVILNSLSGEFLQKSFSLLAPYGRFIEIGKRDIIMNASLPMQTFNHNTTFTAVDLDKTFMDQPRMIKRLLKDAYRYFEKGIFTPLPCQAFAARQAVDAFQFMARAKHTGKIMLTFKEETVEGTPLTAAEPIVSGDFSYLITGGFSGFGLAAAAWLAKLGARHLILAGRSGASTFEAQEALESLRKAGVAVKAAAVDITDKTALSLLLQECERTMPPLQGIIHSAMVLQDALLRDQTQETFDAVLKPKVLGCMNLHQLTLGKPLDFFVLFSSISSLIGNPGQSNYAGANAFLDAFCHYRRALGLPAVTINWGALQMGALVRDRHTAKYLENHGIQAMQINTALAILEKAIRSKESHLCAFAVKWEKLFRAMPQLKTTAFFADFSAGSAQDSSSHFIDLLEPLDEAARLQAIVEKIKELVAQSLKIDPNQLDPSTRLTELGVDSLMAMELEAGIESKLGLKIPTVELMKGASITQLAQSLCKNLFAMPQT